MNTPDDILRAAYERDCYDHECTRCHKPNVHVTDGAKECERHEEESPLCTDCVEEIAFCKLDCPAIADPKAEHPADCGVWKD